MPGSKPISFKRRIFDWRALQKQSGKYTSQEECFSDELVGKSSTPLIKCLHLWGDVRCSDEMFFE